LDSGNCVNTIKTNSVGNRKCAVTIFNNCIICKVAIINSRINTRSAVNVVIASAACDDIIIRAAKYGVTPVTAINCVIASAACQLILAATTINYIITLAAIDCVNIIASRNEVDTTKGEDNIVTIAAFNCVAIIRPDDKIIP